MTHEKDIFRDTWVRYCGYANEVGEAFRPIVPRRVVAYSYAVAFGYVFADTAHKTQKSIRNDGRFKKVAIDSIDAILWQTFASVIIPGLTINRISTFTHRNLSKLAIPPMAAKWASVGVALGCIPIIVGPIDRAVTFVMDHSYRKWYKATPCIPGGSFKPVSMG